MLNDNRYSKLLLCGRGGQIYDIQTGQNILTLNNPDLANNYKRNCATFNPTDDLVLNDGVLWDVRSAQAIHKFDKFNMNISGVFHPNCLEVVINTEIVSLATVRLRRRRGGVRLPASRSLGVSGSGSANRG